MLTENKVKKGEWSCNSLSRKAGFTRIFLKITYIYKVYCYKRTFVLFDVNWVISSNKRNWRTNGHCSIKQLQICGEENTFLTMFSVFLLRRSAPAYVTMVFPGHHRNVQKQFCVSHCISVRDERLQSCIYVKRAIPQCRYTFQPLNMNVIAGNILAMQTATLNLCLHSKEQHNSHKNEKTLTCISGKLTANEDVHVCVYLCVRVCVCVCLRLPETLNLKKKNKLADKYNVVKSKLLLLKCSWAEPWSSRKWKHSLST